MAARFGTSGLRGLADELSEAVVTRYISAFVSNFSHGGALVVGQDLRASSPRISSAVVDCAQEAGLLVLDCGVLPTPALALECAKRAVPGVMVTGSHIPANRNGLKFYTTDGEFTKADEAVLVKAVETGQTAASRVGGAVETCDATQAYIARYVSFFGRNALRGRRFGVWEHSSAARDVLPRILSELGAEVVSLARSDEFVAVDTEAIDVDVRAKLRGWTEEFRLDAIVSTDGDADRPLLVDERGNVVPGDILGPLVARALGARNVVTTVSANTLVEGMGVFEKASRCRIGSPYVIERMEELSGSGAERVLGYEPNGGVLLGFEAERDGRRMGRLMTRDAVLPIAAALCAMSGETISGLIAGLPNRRTATDRLTDVSAEVSASIVDEVLAGTSDLMPIELGGIVDVDTTDGARMTMGNGVIVTIRPSGNAPELRCYVEAESAAVASGLLSELLERLSEMARP